MGFEVFYDFASQLEYQLVAFAEGCSCYDNYLEIGRDRLE